MAAGDRPEFDLVVWDFDGVLNANIRAGRFVWADTMQDDLGLHPTAFQDFVFRSPGIVDVISGQLDLLDAVTPWLEGQGATITPAAFLEYWFARDAMPDAEVTGWMRAHAGSRVIGTNNETRRTGYIEDTMGYGALVDRVFSSGRLGIAKPHDGFFHHIADWAELDPARILLVDDSAANVDAATALGWQGFHFTPETRSTLPACLNLPT